MTARVDFSELATRPVQFSDLKPGDILRVLKPLSGHRGAARLDELGSYVQPGQLVVAGAYSPALEGDARRFDVISPDGLHVLERVAIPFYYPGAQPDGSYAHGRTTVADPFGLLTEQADIERIKALYEKSLKKGFVENCPQWRNFNSGGDPELFVLDSKGKLMPAFTFLAEKERSGSSLQAFWDGFQGEFTFPSASCLQLLADYVFVGLNIILTRARAKDKGAKLSLTTVQEVDTDELKKLDPKHVELGCLPSLNAYGVEPLRVVDPYSLNLRFAGAHMHFGLAALGAFDAPAIVKTLDSILGTALVALFQGLEDPRRRMFYGRAGEYRTPSHGLEYRVPPPMIMCSPIVLHLSYELARQAIGLQMKGWSHLWESSEEEVQEIINYSDVDGAKKLLKKNREVLKGLLSGVFKRFDKSHGYQGGEQIVKNAFMLLKDGVKEHLSVDPEQNWENLGHVGRGWGAGKPKQFSTWSAAGKGVTAASAAS